MRKGKKTKNKKIKKKNFKLSVAIAVASLPESQRIRVGMFMS